VKNPQQNQRAVFQRQAQEAVVSSSYPSDERRSSSGGAARRHADSRLEGLSSTQKVERAQVFNRQIVDLVKSGRFVK